MPNLNFLNHLVPAGLAGQLIPLTITVPEACRISGYSRSELYRRLASGDLEGVKMGRSLRIVMGSIYSSLASLPRAEFGSPNALAPSRDASRAAPSGGRKSKSTLAIGEAMQQTAV